MHQGSVDENYVSDPIAELLAQQGKLAHQIADWEQELTRKNSTQSALQKQVKELKQQVTQKNQQVIDLNREVTELNQQVVKGQHRNDLLSAEITGVKHSPKYLEYLRQELNRLDRDIYDNGRNFTGEKNRAYLAQYKKLHDEIQQLEQGQVASKSTGNR